MNEVVIELFPAFSGDCILVTFETIDYRILIDGGFSKTFSIALASKLQSLDADRKAIDLLVVTHVDNDHIMGIIELFRALKRKKISIEIREIWYNGYRHLFLREKQCASESQEKLILDEVMKKSIPETEMLGKEIGYAQGETLAELLSETWEKEWNLSFNGQAVCCCNDKAVLKTLCKNRLFLILLGPGEAELQALEREWNNYRRKKWLPMVNGNSIIYEECFERFLTWADPSITNQSSIAFLLEYEGQAGQVYRMLFLGDALTERCLGRMERWKMLKFDCLKLPHHGSKNNISQKTLNSLHVDNILFSTNGKKYKHPDWEVVEEIAHAKNCQRMVFNYDECMVIDRIKREYPDKKIKVGIDGYCKIELGEK